MRLFLLFCIGTVLLPTAAESHTIAALHTAERMRLNITVRQLSPIAFGTFASSGNGGTITISAGSGVRTITGAVSTLSLGDYGQAEFAIYGQSGQEVVITPPASAVLNASSAGGNMTITNFKVSPADIVTLNPEGAAKIKIGGTLKVPGSVTQGKYSGFFNVAAHYVYSH